MTEKQIVEEGTELQGSEKDSTEVNRNGEFQKK